MSSTLICFLYYHSLMSLMSSMAFSTAPASSDWFRVRGFLHISPPSHEQNIVLPSLKQLQEAFLHPGVLQLQ